MRWSLQRRKDAMKWNGGNSGLTLATMEATLPEKTQGFVPRDPESVFIREFTRDDMMMTRLPLDIRYSACHKSSTIVYNYLSRSCYNAFSNLQLQSRVQGAWKHRHSRLQTRIAGASRQTDQHSPVRARPHKSGAAPRPSVFLMIVMWKGALATVWCTFCQPHLSKSAPASSVF